MTRFDTDPYFVRANASHRAGRASHQANLCCLGHSATIAFASGPAVKWLFERDELAKQLNADSLKDTPE